MPCWTSGVVHVQGFDHMMLAVWMLSMEFFGQLCCWWVFFIEMPIGRLTGDGGLTVAVGKVSTESDDTISVTGSFSGSVGKTSE